MEMTSLDGIFKSLKSIEHPEEIRDRRVDGTA
jgi:hypothetical protein